MRIRVPALPVLSVALVAASACLSSPSLAQSAVGVTVGVHRPSLPLGGPESGTSGDVQEPATAGPSRTRHLVTGAIIGAAIGGVLAATTETRCQGPAGFGCHDANAFEGAVSGAAMGALVGWIVWRISR